MMTRNKLYNVYLRHPHVLQLCVWWFQLLSLFQPGKYHDAIMDRKRKIGFARVLNRGEIVAVQGGVCMNPFKRKKMWYDNWSQLWLIATRLGPKGTVIAVEPDPDIAKQIRRVAEASDLKCRVIVVEKALYSSKKQDIFRVADNRGVNRLASVRNSEDWMVNTESQFLEGTKEIPVELDTLDNICEENNIDLSKVAYVNLTINGAEYDALRGMEKILEASPNMAITAVAGRENEGFGENDIGWVDGVPDHVAMKSFLEKFGFNATLKRFWENKYGYLVCTKGKQKAFM